MAYYTHCTAHLVNIVVQYVSKSDSIISILTIVNEIGYLYYNSIQFRNTHISYKLNKLCILELAISG